MTDSLSYAGKLITIERFILDQQQAHPEATGTLTSILYDMALAAKIIASKTTRAGLAEILGSAGEENVQGEEVQILDAFAQRTIFRLNDHTGRLAVMASEEEEEIIPIPSHFPIGSYVLVFDPLDGSSNIDANVSIGTIFGIYRRKTASGPGTLEDVLRPGRDLVAAGYILYGASTMMVYSTGRGVHGFTLDPAIGEFLLSHPDITLPDQPKYYSVNHGYQPYWTPGVKAYTEWLQHHTAPQKKVLSLRYIGSLVADFHRNLLAGGIFYYPADTKDPQKPGGKLRLIYEAVPLSFLMHQAGGYASDGSQAILDIVPTKLHQRVPLYIGNRHLVEQAEGMIREYDEAPHPQTASASSRPE